MFKIFDGHNDTVTKTSAYREGDLRCFLDESEDGHLDLPRARRGGLAGGMFAIFVHEDSYQWDDCDWHAPDDIPVTEDFPMNAVHPDFARRGTMHEWAKLIQMERESKGTFRLVTNIEDLKECLANNVLAGIVHLEGAEAIDVNMNALEVYYRAGLRSIGITWSRHNRFGYGTPAHRMGTGDVGPGLTDAGKRLVKECNRLGVVVDVSHLNEAGFWDVARTSEAPIVATHSNAFALCASPRNLTDAQIDEVGKSGGIIALNFHVGFLREDGDHDNTDTPLETIVAHGRYIADRIGVEHLGLGSDFDGAKMPDAIGDAAGLPKLLEVFSSAGFSDNEIEKVCLGNWLRVLGASWK